MQIVQESSKVMRILQAKNLEYRYFMEDMVQGLFFQNDGAISFFRTFKRCDDWTIGFEYSGMRKLLFTLGLSFFLKP